MPRKNIVPLVLEGNHIIVQNAIEHIIVTQKYLLSIGGIDDLYKVE